MSNITATYIDHMGSDLSVVNAARVSFDKESDWVRHDLRGDEITWQEGESGKRLSDRDAKLIAYLAKHNHKSPFNHTFATFRVKAPIFVARQLVKHEYMPWNEVSRRYVDSEPEFYVPDTWRKRADNVKQGSSDEAAYMMIDIHGEEWIVGDVMKEAFTDSLTIYNNALKAGVCPEQARMVLPQSMMTEWYWSGTLFAFAKMYNLRIDAHSQYETRLVAQQIGEKMSELFPVSWKALTNGN